jgi:tetratricopeptide (TPR) repeat protein
MDNLDYIENYFTGEPEASLKKEFEERITSDPEFAAEVAFYLSAKQVSGDVSRSAKKEQFKELYQNKKTARPAPVRKLVYYFAAAAVAAGIIFGTYIITNTASPTEMANQYIQSNLQNLGVKMGGGADSIQDGLRLYNDGKMTEALATFEKIARADTSSFNAKKYAGIAALRLKEYQKALSYFEQLEIYSGYYSNPALLLQAVTLMERNQPGDQAKAKLLLQKVVANDLEGKEMAVEWLKKM